MNAIDFIKEYVNKNGNDGPWLNVFQQFDNLYKGVCTSGYFRTKYNNYIRSLSDENRNKITISSPIKKEKEIILLENSVRATKNYKNGDKKPELPDLIPTGTIFDEVISDRVTTQEEKDKYLEDFGIEMPEDKIEIGGFSRKCVDIVAGRAGSGKTYSRCILAAKAKIFAKREYNKDIRVGFISAEMRESEWAKELDKCSLLEELEVDYMLDHVGSPNYEDIFWEAFGDYDIVIVDSFPAVLSHFKMSRPEHLPKLTENQMVFSFIKKAIQSVQDNNNNVQLINQANKDGNYKGGTEMPHMMSSMSFVRVEGQQRYIYFEKNRNNGTVNRKLYFSKTANGDIEFNEEAYNATYKITEDKKQSVSEFMETLSNLQRTRINGVLEEENIELISADNEQNDSNQLNLIDSIEEIESENQADLTLN
jgi:hypothetical protein